MRSLLSILFSDITSDYLLFGTCRLTGLATNYLADELDTLALIRLRLTQRTQLSGNLAYELLVNTLQRHDRSTLLLRNSRSRHLLRKHEVRIVRITEAPA